MADIPIETFEKEAADFLDTHASLKEEEKAFVWGEGSDKVALFDEKSREREVQDLKRAQEWRATEYETGVGWVNAPQGSGGRVIPHAYKQGVSAACRSDPMPNHSV